MNKYCLIEPMSLQVAVVDNTILNASIQNVKDIITLCSNDLIRIIMDKLFFNKISMSDPCPFPIDPKDISDDSQRKNILMLNTIFISTIKNKVLIEMGNQCEGNQEFYLNENSNHLIEINDYLELFSLSLMDCYDSHITIDSILFNNQYTKLSSKPINLKCDCQSRNYCNTITPISPNDLIPIRIKTKRILKQVLFEKKNQIEQLTSSDPTIVRSSHGNPYQKRKINTYDQIDSGSRVVLDLLKKFGMFKVHLLEYHVDSSRQIGSITNINLQRFKESDTDIISGELFHASGFSVHASLYFPYGVGELIRDYFGNEIEYMDISDLVSSLNIKEN